MKLQELAVANPTKQAAKVFESYFGKGINFDAVSKSQAQKMLQRVRSLIAEHRRTPGFHRSEQNPTYLKLVVMEQALAGRAVQSEMVEPVTTDQTPQQSAAAQALAQQQKRQQIQDQMRELDKQKGSLQKQLSMLEARPTLRQRLKESEVQQAQVVLASQDMVDQVQKMSEQVSAMQFKDLPALVDQIKNEVGQDQAMQFNTDATAALTGLLQNLQGAKQQLEAALGVVTGQAPTVPGADTGLDADMGAELPAELPAPGEEEIETDIEVDDQDDSNALATSLGRGRR
jgi:hypothetical protein